MTLPSTPSKATLAANAAKGAAKRPQLVRTGVRAAAPAAKLGWKVSKPIVKRRARRQLGEVREAAERLGETARTVVVALATYSPQVAQELGLIEQPKPKRTAPRVAVGVVIGAAGVYLLDPDHGADRRKRLGLAA